MTYFGELAALGTACCWAIGSLFFDAAGRRIGPINVNRIRIPAAALLLALVLWISTGRLLPPEITMPALGWLSLSGIIGLVVGDACFFTSLVILGPQRATLIMSATPVITALIAWPLLGETLGLFALGGITITVAGITWVSAARRGSSTVTRSGSLFKGALWGLGGAAGQAVGLVLAKIGMGAHISPLTATFYRMVAAAGFIWLITICSGRVRSTCTAIRNPKGLLFSLGGALVGPFIGVWLSLIAVKLTAAGIAATIMATVPVLVIPLIIITHRERPSARVLWGSILTVVGVALLFWR